MAVLLRLGGKASHLHVATIYRPELTKENLKRVVKVEKLIFRALAL